MKKIVLKDTAYNVKTGSILGIKHLTANEKMFEIELERGERLGHEPGQFVMVSVFGTGAIEAPRGTLFHNYEIDEKGIIQNANCIIPTNQNLNNIEMDMKKLVPEILDKSEDEITLLLEMLVRAYDPCISCGTHLINVKFVN